MAIDAPMGVLAIAKKIDELYFDGQYISIDVQGHCQNDFVRRSTPLFSEIAVRDLFITIEKIDYLTLF